MIDINFIVNRGQFYNVARFTMQIVVKYSCRYFERPLKWPDLNEM